MTLSARAVESVAPIGGGLSTSEAQDRRRAVGPNSVPAKPSHPWLDFLRRFWGPVPWLLELALALELILGRPVQAVLIGALVLLNAVIAFVQERQADKALQLLRAKLQVNARVLRDGAWTQLPSDDLVPDDVLRIRPGDFVPADVEILDGDVSVDVSALTGESMPAQVSAGRTAFAGAIVQRGEATARVQATGVKTQFGRTAQLVGAAHARGRLEQTIFSIVKALMTFNAGLIAIVLLHGALTHLDWRELLPFALMLIVASVPVALPATFSLTMALGSRELTQKGVLVTRLASIEELACMDVLCTDKTGTLTGNVLTVVDVRPFPPFSPEDVLRFAALASEDATNDPIDLAVLAAAPAGVPFRDRTRFVPYDAATKRTEAFVRTAAGEQHILKGASNEVAKVCGQEEACAAAVEQIAVAGLRAIAVATNGGAGFQLVGLVGLQDPPRPESAEVLTRLKELGLRIVMVTGDGLATARAIAKGLGLGSRGERADALRGRGADAWMDCDLVARVTPEDKFKLVESFQDAGHVVGMTGDGVNDAAALRQADAGIAVANAVDVAKGAASLVLTRAGLGALPEAVEICRRVNQRMLTYTLNKIVKTLQVVLLLTLGLLWLNGFITTPRHILLLLFVNDFITMSLATDRAQASGEPERWPTKALLGGGLVLAALWLGLCFAVLGWARNELGLELGQLQTLTFLLLVLTGQATVYLVRQRGPFWSSRPGRWLVVTSVAIIILVFALVAGGIGMQRLPIRLILDVTLLVFFATFVVDAVKVQVFGRLGLGGLAEPSAHPISAPRPQG